MSKKLSELKDEFTFRKVRCMFSLTDVAHSEQQFHQQEAPTDWHRVVPEKMFANY
jgi:hypothetical protein